MIRFAHPLFLFLIPVIAFLFLFLKRKSGIKFSSVALLRKAGSGKKLLYKTGKLLAFLGIAAAAVALARPQTTTQFDIFNRRGVDIAVVLDVSGSMQSVDFEPNRMEVARKTVDDFVSQRTGDRIALIVFAGEAFTRVPLTLDRNILRESLASVTTDSVNTDGTAIGMAISVGVNRLKKSDAASRVMILLTDGDNNAGAIDPLTASKLAQELGIKIYTVGVGSDYMVFPVQSFGGRTHYQQYDGGFDEALLQRIAETTGGQYYRAKDPKALAQIFETINRLEKTEFTDENFKEYNELAYPFIQAALLLLLAGIFLDKFYFVQVP